MRSKIIDKAAPELKHNETRSAMMAYWDRNLICRFANWAYLDWMGRSPAEMIDKLSLRDMLGATTFKKNVPFIEGVLRGKSQIFTRLLVTASGDLKNTVSAYYPDIQHNVVVGFYAHIVDISDLDTLEVEKILYQVQSRSSIAAMVNENGGAEISPFSGDSKMEKVAETLKANILNKFPGLNQLAKIHCVSVSKLKRDFKTIYHLSPHAYYRNLQMEFADYYMSNTKCSKKEVAAMLDFSNPANFYSLFKKYRTRATVTHN